MTDFVERVLGRSAVPPIRPLIPTLFEPMTRRFTDEPTPAGTFTDNGHSDAAAPVHHSVDNTTPPLTPSSPAEPTNAVVPQGKSETAERPTATEVPSPGYPPVPEPDLSPSVNPTLPPIVSTVYRESGVQNPGRHPDVHINIGRVEIKATDATPDPRQRRSTRRPPQLSLAEYLQSRGADRP